MLHLLLRLARTVHLGTTAALLIAAGLQAFSFVLVARGLGVAAFGSLMIASAVTQFTVDAVSLGAGEALVRRVARDRSAYGGALGHALIMTTVTGVVLGLLSLAVVQHLVAEIPLAAAAIFVFGELLGGRLTGLCEHVFIGHSRIVAANVVRLVAAAARLVAVALMSAMTGLHAVGPWAVVQGTTTLATGVACLVATMSLVGPPRVQFRREDLLFGAMVSLNHLSGSIQFSVDRVVLGLTSTPAVVGAYAAGVRGIQLALLPVLAIMRNLYAKFFELGEQGIQATRKFARANLGTLVLVGALAGGVLYVGADLIVLVLGKDFSDSAGILRALAWVPMIRGVQLVWADALSGAGYQVVRTSLGVAGCVLFLAAIAVLAPRYGAWGAVAAVYVHQLGLAAATFGITRALPGERE